MECLWSDTAQVLGVLQQAANHMTSGFGALCGLNGADAEMHKSVAKLGPLPLPCTVVPEASWVVSVAARSGAVIVGPVCSGPGAAGRAEDDHVIFALEDTTEAVLLNLVI